MHHQYQNLKYMFVIEIGNVLEPLTRWKTIRDYYDVPLPSRSLEQPISSAVHMLFLNTYVTNVALPDTCSNLPLS